ncbi:uncharacterized protein VTP21DRAFT_7701 [Calcarisporiella thermophila]|uniref:uncharacterized protein n=1 Tax=Calcarisporiella thermophila TaxID=911321 RepID=UPI003742C08A
MPPRRTTSRKEETPLRKSARRKKDEEEELLEEPEQPRRSRRSTRLRGGESEDELTAITPVPKRRRATKTAEEQPNGRRTTWNTSSKKDSSPLPADGYEQPEQEEQELEPETNARKKKSSVVINSPPTFHTSKSRELNSLNEEEEDASDPWTRDGKRGKSMPIISRKSSRTARSARETSLERTEIKNLTEEVEHWRKQYDILKETMEAMEKKYESLKELRTTEAERNFEEYRKNAEKRFNAADEVIAQLRREKEQMEKELQKLQHAAVPSGRMDKKRMQNAHTQTPELQDQSLSSHREEISKPSEQEKSAKEEIESLKEQIKLLKCERDAEIKNTRQLTAKLQKQSYATTISANSSNSKAKLDLYQELTGLLVKDVKSLDEGIIFDCLQLGRDKEPLHFKLIQPTSEDLVYHPFLDQREPGAPELLRILPDYLTEEIEFSKEHADRFFWRLLNFMQKPTEQTK